MPTEAKVLLRIVSDLCSLIADMIQYIPVNKVQEFRDRYMEIIGERNDRTTD